MQRFEKVASAWFAEDDSRLRITGRTSSPLIQATFSLREPFLPSRAFSEMSCSTARARPGTSDAPALTATRMLYRAMSCSAGERASRNVFSYATSLEGEEPEDSKAALDVKEVMFASDIQSPVRTSMGS